MRILITGAAGFVGSYLLAAIQENLDAVAQIAAWDIAPHLLKSDNTVSWSNVDITNAEQVTQAIANFNPSHIIHLAAISHIPTALKYPQKTWQVNVFGTLNLMEAVKKNCPQCVVIYVSSSEVYGSSFNEQHDGGVTENTLLQPRNPYAASKAAADLMMGQYAEQGLYTIRLRSFNHTGAGQSEDFVVAAFASQIARIEQSVQPPIMYVGNLDAMRDFLDVRDVVAAYIQTLKKSQNSVTKNFISGSIFNLASGVPRRITDILQTLLEYSTVAIEVRQDQSRMRRADIPVAFGANAKAISYLAWQPKIAWNDTLLSVLNYWRARPFAF